MDGVKRYDPSEGGGVEEVDGVGTYVCASDFDAALAREAALREELAERNAVIELKQRDLIEAQTAVTGWAAKCKAAEQRNAELTHALERGKMWVGQYRAWYGDSGVVAEDHLMIIRTLKGLPHPPTEFDKPTESGASALDPKIIGIERMPPMEYDEP